jgi:hypothetical protein
MRNVASTTRVFLALQPDDLCRGIGVTSDYSTIQRFGRSRTRFAYDLEWQKTKQIVGAGSPDASTNAFIYNPVGNVVTNLDGRGKAWGVF